MAYLKIKNRAFSTLAADIISTATSLSVAAGEGAKFPSAGDFHLNRLDYSGRRRRYIGFQCRQRCHYN